MNWRANRPLAVAQKKKVEYVEGRKVYFAFPVSMYALNASLVAATSDSLTPERSHQGEVLLKRSTLTEIPDTIGFYQCFLT